VLLGIVGTAAGLNLTVMNIGAGQIDNTPELALPAASSEPEVRQVVVDVPVPVREIEAAAAPPSNAVATASVQPAAAPAAAVPPPVPPTAAPVPVAPVTTAAPAPTSPPATTATTAPAPTTAPSTAPVPATEYLTYGFDGVAEIIVAFHDGERLEFWSAVPDDGWAYMVETNSPSKVEVEFRRVSGGEGEAKFVVKIEDGELEVKKER
jgi:hypothetical protein